MPDEPKKDPTFSFKDPEPSLREKAAAEAARVGAEAAVQAAVGAVGKAAHGALDAIENLLFGKVGGAEEQLRKDAGKTPLERLRGELGEPEKQATQPKPDPLEEAKRQLAELKKQAARDDDPPPMKKTM